MQERMDLTIYFINDTSIFYIRTKIRNRYIDFMSKYRTLTFFQKCNFFEYNFEF